MTRLLVFHIDPREMSRFIKCERHLDSHGLLLRQRNAKNPAVVLQTMSGGDLLDNDEHKILEVVTRAIHASREHGLDIRVVSYGEPSPALLKMISQRHRS